MQLPTISFLHGKENLEENFIEIECLLANCEVELQSPITSALFNSPDLLKKFYMEERDFLPIKVSHTRSSETYKNLKITWDKVNIRLIQDEKFGKLFELDILLS